MRWRMFCKPSKLQDIYFSILCSNTLSGISDKPYSYTVFSRYEEAREEEKLRTQKEDFSDMVAEVNSTPLSIHLVLVSF